MLSMRVFLKSVGLSVSCCILSGLLYGVSAHAAIGDYASAVESDRVALKGSTVQVTYAPNFTVYTYTAGLTTVKEFANLNGVIFAISWTGMNHPNLSVLLGNKYVAYAAKRAAQPRLHIRHPVNVKSKDLVVRRGGHMRDWHGIAVLKSLLPAGVTEADLQ